MCGDRVLEMGGGGALGARGVHRMLTRHVGAAAYIISRQAAESLLEYMTPLRDAADEVMFNEKYGWLPQANVYQVSPAMAMQADRMDDADIQDKSFAAGSIAMRKAAGDSAFYEPFGSRVSRRLYNEILARKRRSAYCIVPFKSNAD